MPELELLLVCSNGGHLSHLWWLRPFWSRHRRRWVVLDAPDSRARLQGERVTWVQGPTNRSVRALLRNGRLARRLLAAARPDVVLSTGAAVAVPFFWWAAWMRIPTVYLEVVDRLAGPSLSLRLVRPVTDRLVVLDPRQRSWAPEAQYLGPPP